MIVGIDNITPGTSTSASSSLGGMRPYLADLLEGLPAILPSWQFKLFTPTWNEPFRARHPNLATVRVRSPRNRVGRVLFEQAVLPAQIAIHNVDLWLGTCNYLPLFTAARTVLLIQSHQFFTNPEAFTRGRGAWLRLITSRSVAKANLVGVQCESAGQTLRKYIPLAPEKLRVIFNRVPEMATDFGFDIWSLLGVRCPYLVYISGFYPFKNHARLVEAFRRIKTRIPGLKLLLVGGGDRANRFRNLDPDVMVTGRVPDAAIPALYRNALASLFPSLEETFGLPVLEAMSVGCPVITSARSSMAELASDAAVLVDPCDPVSIADGMARVIEDPDLRKDLSRRGPLRAAAFTRERTVEAVASALREAATQAYPALAYNTE